MSDYNGAPNRATWNVWLQLCNANAQVYRGMLRWIKNTPTITPQAAKAYCLWLWPSGRTPDGDSLDDVVWPHIVHDMNDKRDEAEELK